MRNEKRFGYREVNGNIGWYRCMSRWKWLSSSD